MFHTLHCPRCRAWLYCPGRVGASAVQPQTRGDHSSPGPPKALARSGREWAVPPRTPKVETLWAVGGSPHHRPEIHQGQPRDAHAPRAARRGESPRVPKPAASARARDPGINARGGTRTLTPGPAAAGSRAPKRSAHVRPPAAEPLCGGPVQ
ncbi:hypothetical protein GQ602_007404 [Ophiocordyceps camponoti-floridani]|uniref:Uncharacterized protein n=1 Tax=Ophiocordyceps camponoti-floridani TaxID=2030778 RepID=A0A8H4Q0A5_9HYPO|nr:hypothetical protein GQ602_007404 [Ophiocordyceps camponoti-floridani]